MCSPPVRAVDFYWVGDITFSTFYFVAIFMVSSVKNVGNGAETGIFESVSPKTTTCKGSAHIIGVCESVIVFCLVIDGELVV